MKKITPEQLKTLIGHQCDATPWFEINQAQVNDFADCTLDHQFIHVDPEKAAQTPFGGTIAHGMLSLSLIAHFAKSFTFDVEGTEIGINYGFNKVRFLTPVNVGARIRAHAIFKAVEQKSNSNEFLMTYSVSVEIEGSETPALAADWLVLIITRPVSLG